MRQWPGLSAAPGFVGQQLDLGSPKPQLDIAGASHHLCSGQDVLQDVPRSASVGPLDMVGPW